VNGGVVMRFFKGLPMPGKSKDFLNVLLSLTGKTCKPFVVDGDLIHLRDAIHTVPVRTEAFLPELDALLKYLSDAGLVLEIEKNTYCLTYKALYKRDFDYEFLTKSVLVPIVVSIATTTLISLVRLIFLLIGSK